MDLLEKEETTGRVSGKIQGQMYTIQLYTMQQ